MKARRLLRETDLETGVAVSEAYRLNGRLHRDPNEGPAFIVRNPATGLLVKQRYYWHGRLHRPNGPARRAYDENGMLLYEQYYCHGVMNRDPGQGPAWIERQVDGSLTGYYVVNDKLLREAPASPSDLTPFVNSGAEHDADSRGDQIPLRSPQPRKGPEPGPAV